MTSFQKTLYILLFIAALFGLFLTLFPRVMTIETQAIEPPTPTSQDYGVTNFTDLFELFQAFGVTDISKINQLFALGTNPTYESVAKVLGVPTLTSLPGMGTVADLMSILNAPELPSFLSDIPGMSTIKETFKLLEGYGIKDLSKVTELLKLPELPSLGDLAKKLGLPDIPNLPQLPGLDKVFGFMKKADNALEKLSSKLPKVSTILKFASINWKGFYGGVLLKKDLKWCLRTAPPPVFVIAIPYWYLEVGPPTPAKMYKFIGIGKVYREDKLTENVWVLGRFWPQAHEAFKQLCNINKKWMPKADGLFRHAGTSCKIGEGISCRKQKADFDLPTDIFNPLDSEYSEFCDPLSPPGECLPPPDTQGP